MQGLRVLIVLLCASLGSTAASAQNPTFFSRDYYPRIRLVFAMDDWHQRLKANYDSGNNQFVPADMYLDGVIYPQVGVQHKGDASYTGRLRENTKITVDAFIPDQRVYGYDVITLDAGRQSSIFNEVATFFLMRDWTEVPLANIANLECGTASNMKKLGVFTNTERVDGTFFQSRFGSRGHRYLPNGFKLPFIYNGTDYKNYHNLYSHQGGDPADAYHDVADASIALHNSDENTVKALLDPFADTDACMRLLIGHRMANGIDGFEKGNNYYLCEEERHGSRIVPVPWDADITWGNIKEPLDFQDRGGNSIPLQVLFDSTEQEQRAQTMVRHYLEGALAGTQIADLLWQLKAQALADLLGSPHDDIDDEADIDFRINDIIGSVDKSKTWNADPRFNRELPQITVYEPEPPSPAAGESVRITAKVSISSTPTDRVSLWSRTRGAFTEQLMYDDGAHDDYKANDGIWAAELPLAAGGEVQEYYVEARPLDLAVAHYGFEPRQMEFRSLTVYVRFPEGGTLLLNEFVSDNQSGDEDEAGDAEDWLEIVNLAAVDHDLGGAWLSDDRSQPQAWSFPAGTIVPAGGHLRVWCDAEEEEGPLHANFRLSRAGEVVRLTSSDASGNVVLDEAVVPALEEDDAWGRVPDGGWHWFHVAKPTGEDFVAPAGKDNAYDVRADGAASGFRLNADGDLEVGERMRFELRNGPPNSLALLYVGLDADRVDAGSRGWLLVDLRARLVLRLGLDSFGEKDLEFDVPDIAAGLRIHAQAIALQADFSNGIVVTIEH